MLEKLGLRIAARLGGIAIVGLIAAPGAIAQQQAFTYTAPVNVALTNTFGIDTSDTLTAIVLYDPSLITGTGLESIAVGGAGELAFTLDSLLFEGNTGFLTNPSIGFLNGQFDGINYINRTNDIPTGISLETSNGFSFDRPIDSTTEIFATGGPFMLSSTN